MKTVKRISGILKTIGIVLLLLSLVISFYALTSNGASRNALLNIMRDSGVSTNVFSGIPADRTIYQAMSVAAQKQGVDDKVRAEAILPIFDSYTARAEKGLARKSEELLQSTAAQLAEESWLRDFVTRYEQMDDLVETRAITAAIEYLDSFQPVAKPGKKLPGLKAESCASFMQSSYDALVEAHGEEAGTYLEYLETVAAIIKDTVTQGGTVSTARDFVSKSLTYEAYTARLPEIRAAERAEEQGNLLDTFAELAQKKLAGETVDMAAYLNQAYDTLQAAYPTETMPSRGAFASAMFTLLQSNSYDGAPATTMTAVRNAAQSEAKLGLTARMTEFCGTVVKSSDDQSPAPFFSYVWILVANYAAMFVAGILLILLAKVLNVVVTKRLLAQRKDAGITEDPDVLLRVEHLKQYFRSGNYVNRAVDDISFFVKKGEVFGLVGESGCGKTTTGRTIINLYNPTEGDVYFQGLRISSTEAGLPVLIRQMKNDHKETLRKLKEDYTKRSEAEPAKKAELQKAFNEEKQRLNNELAQRIEAARDHALESSVEKSKCVEMYREKRKAELTAQYEQDIQSLTGKALAERKNRYDIEMKVAARDNIMTRMQMIFQDPIASINPRMTVREIIAEGLVIRGIKDKDYIDKKVKEMLELVGLVSEHADRYPHEFSGGQRQRIGIARAIVMEPDLIIADEPISALDVSIQAQVINLLNDLRNKMGLTILFIAHNLSVVKYFSDRIAVMYFGKIMELTTSDELFEHPLHPYTKSLLSAIPYPDPHYEKQRVRVEYNPMKAHDYSKDKPSLREIKPGHYIHCNDAEFEQYKKELGL